MEILEEAKRYIETLDGVPGFLDKAELKRQTLRQGDYTFTGIR
jgi:hypothetical protein